MKIGAVSFFEVGSIPLDYFFLKVFNILKLKDLRLEFRHQFLHTLRYLQ